MNNEKSYSKVLPVLFGFFIMGFVDVVWISTNYVKQEFALNDTLANLLPMMVFLVGFRFNWFSGWKASGFICGIRLLAV